MNGRHPAERLAEQWHGGQASALYALQCGARDPDTMRGAAIEFRECAVLCETDSMKGELYDWRAEREALNLWADWCETLTNEADNG